MSIFPRNVKSPIAKTPDFYYLTQLDDIAKFSPCYDEDNASYVHSHRYSIVRPGVLRITVGPDCGVPSEKSGVIDVQVDFTDAQLQILDYILTHHEFSGIYNEIRPWAELADITVPNVPAAPVTDKVLDVIIQIPFLSFIAIRRLDYMLRKS